MKRSTGENIASGCGFAVLGVGTLTGGGIWILGLYNILKAGGPLAWIWGTCTAALVLSLSWVAWKVMRSIRG